MTMQEVIDFLLDLIRNEDTQAAFERDPEGVLEDRGLAGITAQDVRDARLELADRGGASPVGDGPPPGGNDPIAELRFTEDNFAAGPDAPGPEGDGPDIIEQTSTIIAIDDRDTLVIQNTTTSDDDVTVIQDSFNDSSTTDVVAIQANQTTTIVDGPDPLAADPGIEVNPPPAAVVTQPGAEIAAPGEDEPDQAAAPVDPPADTELADDAPADVDDGDDLAAEPEPVEEADLDATLDTAVI
jgi:hypothetical protein